MGIILDSSIVIAAERRGETVRKILEPVRAGQGEIEVALSVVTIAELAHGAYRATTEAVHRLILLLPRRPLPVFSETRPSSS